MLVLNELSGRKISLSNVSDCDDTFVMQRALGNPNGLIDIMAAGTSMRFLTAFFATSDFEVTLTGTERMRQRPIHVLVDALRSLGARIDYVDNEGFPPLKISGCRLQGGDISLQGNVSSQYISALLMVAPRMQKGLTLHLLGDVISRPYINITISLMRRFGAEVDEIDDHTFRVYPLQYQGGGYLIENDWSAASYWYQMLALVSGGEVQLEGLFQDSLQGDSCIKDLFRPLGVETVFEGNSAILRKQPATITHYEADLKRCPDLAQTMVATCVALGITFRFTGLETLRIKETDRLLALRQELRKFGFVVNEIDGSALEWDGQRLSVDEVPVIDTYDDHRMAMSMAPLSILSGSLVINDAQVVSKSYPSFWKDLESVGVEIKTCEE